MNHITSKNFSLLTALLATAVLFAACTGQQPAVQNQADSELQNAINQLIDEITTQPDEPLPDWAIGPFQRGEVDGKPMVFRQDLDWSDPVAGDEWKPNDVWNPSLLEVDGRLYLFYRAGPELERLGSRIALAWSDDGGATWTDYENNPILYPTEDWEAASIEDPVVYKYDGTYYLFYQAAQDKPGGGVYADIALATSDDLLHWEKHGRVVPRSITKGWAKGPAIARSPDGEAVKIDGEFRMFLSELPHVGPTDVEEQMIGRSTDLVNWTFEQRPYLDPDENEGIKSIYQVATAVTNFPGSDNLVLDFYYTEPDGGYGCAQALYSKDDLTKQLGFTDYGVCTWGGIIEYNGKWLFAQGWEEPEALHLYTAPIN